MPPPLKGTHLLPDWQPAVLTDQLHLVDARSETSPDSKRVLPITLITAYQFIKAGVLLLAAVSISGDTQGNLAANLQSHPFLTLLIDIARLQNFDVQDPRMSEIVARLTFLALWFAAVAVGMALMQQWARRCLIASSVLAMIRLGLLLVVMRAAGIAASLTWPQQLVLSLFILLEALTISSLIFESESFRVQD
jgi:hypothetical protein